MIARLCLALVGALAPHLAKAQVFPALYDVTGVATDDVLNIRKAASASSPILATLPPDARSVEVIAPAGDWAMVNTGERSGYVALRFLARQPNADWFDLELPVTCLGTEPFWNFALTPSQGRVVYASPEGEFAAPVTGLWPGDQFAQVAGTAFPQGFATIRGATCSDGMSDRTYGLAIDLFLSGDQTTVRHGCCTLLPAPPT